jgi:hypothetical protein
LVALANGVGAKKPYDIEDALCWAVIELLRHEREADGRFAGVSTMSPMIRLLLVGRGGRDSGYVPMGGPPHRDALTIQAAILGLRRFAAVEISGRCGLVDEIGPEIDELGAVRHALSTIVELVVIHAKTGRRPAAGLEQPEPKPSYTPNGRPRVLTRTVIEDMGGMPYATEVQDLSAIFTRQEAERAAAERRQGRRRSRPVSSNPARRIPEPLRGAAKA